MSYSSLFCLVSLLFFAAQVKCGNYLSPSSGYFVAPLAIQDNSTPQSYLKSIFTDIPDILKCLPRFIAGRISSGTESAVLSMTQPVNSVINEKMTEEYILKCLGGAGMGDSDAAEVFIRKLGNKIIKEDDWRVAGKSLFIMHQMLTSSSISVDVVRELAESFLDRYGLLASAIQTRISRSQGDKQALLWVQQYLVYIRSLSEMVRRRSGGREVQDFRSLLRLSSGYCSSAARLLDVSKPASNADTSTLSPSSRMFFSLLSSSCNALVQSDVRDHSGSLASLSSSVSASCSLQQASLSEIQTHAKSIREAVTHILESGPSSQSPRAPEVLRSVSGIRLSRSVKGSSSAGRDAFFNVAPDTKGCWLDSLAEMQCDINQVVTPTSSVDDRQSSDRIRISSRKRNKFALTV